MPISFDPCSPIRCNNLHIIDCQDNMVYCEDLDETVAMIGMSDIIVIRFGKKTIIARRNRIDDVKKLVDVFIKDGK